MRIKLSACFFLLAALVPSPFAAVQHNTLSPAEAKAGWVLLFDGATKAGWHAGPTGTTNTWSIQDSSMTNPVTTTHSVDYAGTYELFTNDTSFSNFEFSAEWKLNLGGNSGIFIRVDRRHRACSASEFQVLDDVNHADASVLSKNPGETTVPIRRTASGYDLYPTTQDGVIGGSYVSAAKPYYEWSKGTIWANDSLIEHWLNGQKVTDFTISSDTNSNWYKRFKLSKYYTQTYCPTSMTNYRQTWARKPSGPFALQDHGDGTQVWYRNIKVRRFTPGEKLVSPLITSNQSLIGPAKVVLETAITGSTIRYTVDGSTPTDSSPVYTDTIRLYASATVKAKTFRPRFQTSDVESAGFVIIPSSVRMDGKSGGSRQAFLVGKKLFVANPGSESYTVELLTLNGRKRASFSGGTGSTTEFDLRDLEAGLYWVRAYDAKGHAETQRIFLP
jgi:hypothetical protein